MLRLFFALLTITTVYCKYDPTDFVELPVVKNKLDNSNSETYLELRSMLDKLVDISPIGLITLRLDDLILKYYLNPLYHEIVYQILRDMEKSPSNEFTTCFFSLLKFVPFDVQHFYKDEDLMTRFLQAFQSTSNKLGLRATSYSACIQQVQKFCSLVPFFDSVDWGCLPKPLIVSLRSLGNATEEADAIVEKLWNKADEKKLFKYVSLFVGDKFIRNLSLNLFEPKGIHVALEGGQDLNALSFLRFLLKKVPTFSNEELFAKYLSLIDHSLAFICGKPAHEKINAVFSLLSSMGSVIIPVSYPGHAMLLYIEKNGDFLTFKLFNSGEGMQYHPQKTNPLTFKDVAHVPDLFWYSLFRIQDHPLIDSTENAEHFYKIIMGMLPASNIIIPNDSLILDGQQSGTCSIKSLTLFSKYFLGAELYNRLIYPLKAEAVLLLDSVDILKFDYQMQYLSSQLVAEISERFYDSAADKKSLVISKMSDLKQKWASLEGLPIPHPSWLYQSANVKSIAKKTPQIVADIEIEILSKAYSTDINDSLVPKYWRYCLYFIKIKGYFEDMSTMNSNPCSVFEELSEIYKNLSFGARSDEYLHYQMSITLFLMCHCYEFCEKASNSPLAGLLSDLYHINDVNADFDKNAFLLTLQRKSDAFLVFELKVLKANPTFPPNTFYSTAWKLLEERGCKCPESFEKQGLSLNAEFSLFFQKPCYCEGLGNFPSENFYTFRNLAALNSYSKCYTTKNFEFSGNCHDYGGDYLLFDFIPQNTQFVRKPLHFQFGAEKTSLKFSKSSSKYDREFQNFQKMRLEALQFNTIGLVHLFNFLRWRQELLADYPVSEVLYNILVNFESAHVPPILFSYIRSLVMYSVKMFLKTNKKEFAKMANLVLIFSASLANKIPEQMGPFINDLICSYEALIGKREHFVELIRPSSLYLSQPFADYKYALFRDSVDFFGKYNFLGSYFHCRMEENVIKLRPSEVSPSFLSEITKSLCVGESSDWKGQFPLFYSPFCIVDFAEAKITSRVNGPGPWFSKQTVLKSDKFKSLFETDFVPKINDNGIIENSFGFLLSASTFPEVEIWMFKPELEKTCFILSNHELQSVFPLKPMVSESFIFNNRFYVGWMCDSEISIYSKLPSKSLELFLSFDTLIAPESTSVPVELSRLFRPDSIIPWNNAFYVLNHLLDEKTVKLSALGDKWLLNDYCIEISSKIKDFGNNAVMHDGKSFAYLIAEAPSFSATNFSILHFEYNLQSPFKSAFNFSPLRSGGNIVSSAENLSYKRSLSKIVPIPLDFVDNGDLVLSPKTRYESLLMVYQLIQFGILEKAYDILSIQTLADPVSEDEYQMLAWIFYAGMFFKNSMPVSQLISMLALKMSLNSMFEHFPTQTTYNPSCNTKESLSSQLDSKCWHEKWSKFLDFSCPELTNRANYLFTNLNRNIDHLPFRYRYDALNLCKELDYLNLKSEVSTKAIHFQHESKMSIESIKHWLFTKTIPCFGSLLSCIPFSFPKIFTRLNQQQLKTLLFHIFHTDWQTLNSNKSSYNFFLQTLLVSASFADESRDLHAFLIFFSQNEECYVKAKTFIKTAKDYDTLEVKVGHEISLPQPKSRLASQQKSFIIDFTDFKTPEFQDHEGSFLSLLLPSLDDMANEISNLMQAQDQKCSGTDITALKECSSSFQKSIENSSLNFTKAGKLIETNLETLKAIDLDTIRANLSQKYLRLNERFNNSSVGRLEFGVLHQSNYFLSTSHLCKLLVQLKRGIPIVPSNDYVSLHSEILDFLMSLNNYQRAKRIKFKSMEINANCSNKQDKLIAIAEEFVNRKPGALAIEEFIIFEIFANFRLRNSHFDDIYFLTGIPVLKEHLATDPSETNNRILSKAMGGGKSLVISTLLVKMLAKEGKVPVVVFLSSLISTSGKDLLARTSNWFGQKGHLLHCDRALSQSESHLKNIIILVENSIAMGEYLITTPEFLQSFVNGSNEAISKGDRVLISMFQSFFALLAQNSIMIYDEIDELAKPFTELNFVTGEESKLSSRLAKATFDLFQSAISDKSLQSIINFEDLETSISSYNEFRSKLSVPTDLLGKDREMFIKIIDHILPQSLANGFQEEYGLPGALRPGILTAVPYKSSRSPSAKSDFSDPLFIMIKTYLSYIKGGFTEDLIAIFQRSLEEQIMEQVKYENISMEETRIWLILFKYFAKHETKCPQKASQLIKFTSSDMLECVKSLDEKKKFLLFMIHLVVVKQIRYYKNYFSSNFQDLLLLSDYKTIGYTGTLYNPDIFLNYENHFKFKLDESIAPFIIATLEMKNVQIIEASSDLRIPKDLLDLVPPIDCIIDAGGSLRYIDELDLLNEIRGKYSGKKSILFFRPEFENLFVSTGNETFFLSKSDEASIASIAGPIAERFIIYDQFHCTGVDLKQKPDAVGLLTIGPKTILRDLLQAVMRLRDLAKGQTVIIYVEKQTVVSLRKQKKEGKIVLMDIIEYCLYMQNQKIGVELQTAVVQKFEAEEKRQVRLEKKHVSSILKERNYETSKLEDPPMKKLQELFLSDSHISVYWKEKRGKLETTLTAEMTCISEALESTENQVVTESAALSEEQQAIAFLQTISSHHLAYDDSSSHIILPYNPEMIFFTENNEKIFNGFTESKDIKNLYVQKADLDYDMSMFLVRKVKDEIIVRVVSAYHIENFLSRNKQVDPNAGIELLVTLDGDIVFPSYSSSRNVLFEKPDLFTCAEYDNFKELLFSIHLHYGDLNAYLNSAKFGFLQEMMPKFAQQIYNVASTYQYDMCNSFLLRKAVTVSFGFLEGKQHFDDDKEYVDWCILE